MDPAEELARDLHDADRTIGEATGWVGKDWDALPPDTRASFLNKAQSHIDAGEWTKDGGWVDV
jgi:hypothetical protein